LGVASNASIGGNLTVSGNTYLQSANVSQLSVSGSVVGIIFFNGTDTVYVNGSPVATSAGSFTGGTVPNYTLFNTVLEARGNIFANSNVQSISTTTGAIVIGNVGGLGVGGNINSGGSISATEDVITEQKFKFSSNAYIEYNSVSDSIDFVFV
jgi:hypothetical protein